MRQKTALILTGGGFSGALFEIGGLVAFDETFGSHLDARSFDVYVGASAGSVVASLLAHRLSPDELWQASLGRSKVLPPIRQEHVFRSEPPLRIAAAALRHLVSTVRALRRQSIPLSPATFLLAIREGLPAGVLSNEPLRSTMAETFDRLKSHDRFSRLASRLYIPAVELDSGVRVVFGNGHRWNVPISSAVAASCAIPGLFVPVCMNGKHYIDGGVGDLTHLDIALSAGARTIIVFNPFVPVNNDRKEVCFIGPSGRCLTLGEKGFLYVVEQARRVSRAAKLSHEIRWMPAGKGVARIFVIQPLQRQASIFLQSPLSDSSREETLELGYRTARTYFSAHRNEILETLSARSPLSQPA